MSLVLDGLCLLVIQHLQFHHNLTRSWGASPIWMRIWSIRWTLSQHQLIILITCDLNRNSELTVDEFGTFPDPLVYVEWFTAGSSLPSFTAFQSPVPDLEMYQMEHSIHFIPIFLLWALAISFASSEYL